MQKTDLAIVDGARRTAGCVKVTCTLLGLLLLPCGWLAADSLSPIEARVRRHVSEAVEDGLETTDFHHLVFAFSWRGTLPDWSLATRHLNHLDDAQRSDPLMSDELRLLRAELAVAEGRPEEARELFGQMGGLTRWWVRGPTPITELEDFPGQAVMPVLDQGWRAAFGTDPLGWVDLAGVAWPTGRQLVYLATTVTSAREQPVAIRLGVAQCARVWVNGVDVLTTPRPLVQAEDQAVAGAWLQAGPNTVVVAVASEDERWWLRLRLTAPDGSRLVGVRELGTALRPVPPSSRTAPRVRSLESEIRAALERGRDEAALALAAYLVMRHPQPVDASEARVACQAAQEQWPAEARLLEWMITSEPTAVRRLLEEALEADPELHWARTELGRWYHERSLFEEADRLFSAARDEPYVRAVSLDLDAVRWGPLVLADLEANAIHWPLAADAQVILARRAVDGKHWDLARRAVAQLETFAPGLTEVEEIREELAASCGDGEALEALLRNRLERNPNWPELRVRLARLLVAGGELDAAHEMIADGLARCPDHVHLLLEQARLQHTRGHDPEAATLARRVLELRPQDRRAERLLTLLGADQTEEEWRRPVEELWRMAEAAPAAEPTVALLDHVGLHFLPGNLTEERVQKVYLVRDAERADALLAHPLAYVPERHRLRILAARLLRADGSEVSARQSDTPRLSEPEINIYYDTRLRLLRFAEVEDGDLIEIAYVLTETAEANETGPYKGGVLRLGDRLPLLLAEVEMSGPEELLPTWELAHLEGEPERLRDGDGNLTLRWSWQDLPPLPADVPRPPELLVNPHLAYSNHASWDDLGGWYAKHVAPRVRPSRQVEQTAARLTDGVNDRLQRIARIYRFVTDEIRYVGLEFGEHRFRPFPADWVLNHRIGDCKDKAALLVALLGAVDVPARMVMVRIADEGPVVTSLAVLEIFNHAIVYLPEDDLWLDGTATGHDPYPPPTMDQGAWVMVVGEGSKGPQTTPRPGGGVARYRYRLWRDEDGGLRLTIRTEDTGEAADIRRAFFAGTNDPRRYAAWLQGQFPGADLVGEVKSEMRPGRKPAFMELEAVLSRASVRSRGGVLVFPGDIDWAVRMAPAGQRSSPLLIPVRPDLEWTLEVELGRRAEDLPEGAEIETPFGTLKVEISDTVDGYLVHGFFHLEPGLVEAEAVPDLRAFLVNAQRRLSATLEAP